MQRLASLCSPHALGCSLGNLMSLPPPAGFRAVELPKPSEEQIAADVDSQTEPRRPSIISLDWREVTPGHWTARGFEFAAELRWSGEVWLIRAGGIQSKIVCQHARFEDAQERVRMLYRALSGSSPGAV